MFQRSRSVRNLSELAASSDEPVRASSPKIPSASPATLLTKSSSSLFQRSATPPLSIPMITQETLFESIADLGFALYRGDVAAIEKQTETLYAILEETVPLSSDWENIHYWLALANILKCPMGRVTQLRDGELHFNLYRTSYEQAAYHLEHAAADRPNVSSLKILLSDLLKGPARVTREHFVELERFLQQCEREPWRIKRSTDFFIEQAKAYLTIYQDTSLPKLKALHETAYALLQIQRTVSGDLRKASPRTPSPQPMY